MFGPATDGANVSQIESGVRSGYQASLGPAIERDRRMRSPSLGPASPPRSMGTASAPCTSSSGHHDGRPLFAAARGTSVRHLLQDLRQEELRPLVLRIAEE